MSKKKILVVDDDRDLAGLVCVRLESAGYQVDTVFDAAQAMMKINELNPDLVLLDIMMPAGGGIGVLKNLRTSTKTAKLPVIIITGKNDEKTQKITEKLGISGYFVKPMDGAVLVGKITEVLSKS